ncbi:MAG: TetR/AcrR family transcriptional regulator [Candidatus Limnocylindrales bacterium]
MPKAHDQTSPEKGSGGEPTRRRLLTASAELVVERGWGAVTTRAVAKRAGVNQALVHYHFGSIETLRRESVVSRLMPAIGALAEELLDDRPLPESMHRVMRHIDDFDLGTETGVLMAEALLQATRDPAVAGAMGGVMDSWSELLGPRIVKAQERGVVRSDIPAQHLAPLLASFLDGYLIQRMADPAFDPVVAADTLNALLAAPSEDPR